MPPSLPLLILPAPSHVFHLVHGTFARNAAWTQDDSPLSRRLRDVFGPRTLIRRFAWSGRNSIKARGDAASEFRRYLKGAFAEAPSSHHSIIAHSHGGN